MKLQEAIEIEETPLPNRSMIPMERRKAARKLLIEAGKRVLWHKAQHLDGYYELLPGEIEDSCIYCGLPHTGIECPNRGGTK